MLLGAFSLSADSYENYFIQAQRIRRLVQGDFDAAFRAGNPVASSTSSSPSTGVDLLVCPTSASPPPRLSSVQGLEEVNAYLTDVFTVPASLAGLPAVSVPVSSEESEAVGIQCIGQYGDDDLVLKAGEVLGES